MTIDEAIRILDPETTQEELKKYGDGYLRHEEVRFAAGQLAADELRNTVDFLQIPNWQIAEYFPSDRKED